MPDMANQISQFGYVLVFMIIGVAFVVIGFTTSRLLRPSRPNPEKLTSYECGEDAVGSSWVQFNIRFYVVALIFILFDVEVIFLFPWTTVFKELGAFAFYEMMLFVSILILGLAYAWVRGDLEWVRPKPIVPTLEPKEIKARRQREAIEAEKAEVK